MNRLPAEISTYVLKLAREVAEIREIWLIGSRANESYRADSDWDFLIFGENLLLNKFSGIENTTSFSVDVLVVNEYPRFSSCDGRKTGSLTDWEWLVNGSVATYKGTKFIPEEDSELSVLAEQSGSELGHEITKTQKGELIWAR